MDASPYYRQMHQALSSWVDLGPAEWDLFRSIFRFRAVDRSEMVLSTGETALEIVFVGAGLLRYFYLDEDGAESNKVFVSESMFTAPLIACLSETRVVCGIQALEPSGILAAPAADFHGLFDRHPIFERLGRKHAEWWMALKEQRARAFQLQGARERYLDFIRLHGDLAQRIPQYHIATYLGITEVSLSRIRRELAGKPRESGAAARPEGR